MTKLGIFWIHQDDIFVLQEAVNQVNPIHDVKDIETGHVIIGILSKEKTLNLDTLGMTKYHGEEFWKRKV